jgi:hypothetical protein
VSITGKEKLNQFKGEYMKKVILMLTLAAVTLIQSPSWAFETVSGYIRSNGTVVAPYIRSSRDGYLFNNLSSFQTEKVINSPFAPKRVASNLDIV